MANPNTPATASFPVPPPLANIPWGRVQPDGSVNLDPTAWSFLQELWAALQGGGGVLDQITALIASYGITGSQIESALSQIAQPAVPAVQRPGAQPIIRFYGDAPPGLLTASQELFNVPMVGDEYFAPGLSQNIGTCAVAPTGSVNFPIQVNGTPIGSMNIAASATAATWTMANPYRAAAGDMLAFYAPTSPDATLSGPRYTFVGTRD